jgi:hypothetical protein
VTAQVELAVSPNVVLLVAGLELSHLKLCPAAHQHRPMTGDPEEHGVVLALSAGCSVHQISVWGRQLLFEQLRELPQLMIMSV